MSKLYLPGRGRRPQPSGAFWKAKWDSVMGLVHKAAEGAPQYIDAQGEGEETRLVLVRVDHPALVGVELEPVELGDGEVPE